MKPVEFLFLLFLPIVGLAAIWSIPLVQTMLTNSGYNSAEVFSGLMGVWVVIMCIMGVFVVR